MTQGNLGCMNPVVDHFIGNEFKDMRERTTEIKRLIVQAMQVVANLANQHEYESTQRDSWSPEISYPI